MDRSDIEQARLTAKQRALAAKAAIAEKRRLVKENLALAKARLGKVKRLMADPPPKYYKQPEYSDPSDPEAVDAQDIGALESAFRKRANDEKRRMLAAGDSEHWACICFQTREQKMAFLEAYKLLPLGTKYLDGVAVARVLSGLKLPEANVPYNTSEKIDKTWLEFVE